MLLWLAGHYSHYQSATCSTCPAGTVPSLDSQNLSVFTFSVNCSGKDCLYSRFASRAQLVIHSLAPLVHHSLWLLVFRLLLPLRCHCSHCLPCRCVTLT